MGQNGGLTAVFELQAGISVAGYFPRSSISRSTVQRDTPTLVLATSPVITSSLSPVVVVWHLGH